MFLRGFERDGAKTSGRSTLRVSDSKRFFKLQKIRTNKNIILGFLYLSFFGFTCLSAGHHKYV